jgi:glycolate oxidase FAD binding subunit
VSRVRFRGSHAAHRGTEPVLVWSLPAASLLARIDDRSAGSWLLAAGAEPGGTLCLLLEGIPPGVESRTAEALDLMGTGAAAGDDAPDWWGAEPVADGEVLLKLTHEIAGLAHLLSTLDDICAATGLTAHLRGSVGVGAITIGLAGVTDAQALARWVASLRERASSFGGTVVVLEAPGDLKADLDVWGPVGGLQLMRAVKRQFDPENRLAPGRFVGGI